MESDNDLVSILDFDMGIDFETAYNIISHGANESSSNDTHGLEIHTPSEFSIDRSISHILGSNEQTSFDSILQQNETQYHNRQNAPDIQEFHQDLLSVDESYIIESFLNSLVPTEKPRDSNNDLATVEEVNNSFNDAIPGIIPDIESTIPTTLQSEYVPKLVVLPEIPIPNTLIPDDIKNDPPKLRKWKHVYVERQRRDLIKKSFNDLVSLVRFPRPNPAELKKLGFIENENRYKSNSIKNLLVGKRVPKHVLLNFLIEDIELIILSNKQLENLREKYI